MKFLKALKYYFLTDGVELARTIAFILIGYMFIKLIIRGLKKRVNRSKKSEKTLPNFLISLLNIFLIALLCFIALIPYGVNAASFVTVASVFSLGISLALQDTISSLANGIIIVVTKPFVEGEFITINGVDGTVVSINMFHTTLKTADGLMVTIPNSFANTNSVKNYSRLPTRRIDIEIPVSYESNMEEVKKTVLDVVKHQKEILKYPEPTIRLVSYGDSNLNYVLRVWVSGDTYWNVRFDLIEKVLLALNKSKIEISYNQYDIHIKDAHMKEKEMEENENA